MLLFRKSFILSGRHISHDGGNLIFLFKTQKQYLKKYISISKYLKNTKKYEEINKTSIYNKIHRIKHFQTPAMINYRLFDYVSGHIRPRVLLVFLIRKMF